MDIPVVVSVPQETELTAERLPESLEYWTAFVRYPKNSGIWGAVPILATDKNEVIRQLQLNGATLIDSDVMLAKVSLPILMK
jgi:hypothetical protein